MKNNKQKFVFKQVYLLSLVPVLSVFLYLGMMAGGLVEGVYLWTVIALAAMSVAWAGCGYLFARSRITLFQSTLIANLFPILTTVAYFVLYVIGIFGESEVLMNIASIIGALGTGVFGVVGVIFFALAPFSNELLQILLSFIFNIIVFVVGYSIGGSVGKKKKAQKNK
jgi:hypothetical protein